MQHLNVAISTLIIVVGDGEATGVIEKIHASKYQREYFSRVVDSEEIANWGNKIKVN
jgi:hypothetical protein